MTATGAAAAGASKGGARKRVAVVGGTGYGGMELLRLLLGHPDVEVTTITSRSESGPVGDVHGHLRGFTDLEFSNVPALELADGHDAVAARAQRSMTPAAMSVRCCEPSSAIRSTAS